MLNFLRKLRKSNMKGKYLSYAIGEIILVVIGILIAFQLNSWNSDRLEVIKQNKILGNLHEEFLENKAQLDNALITYSSSLKASIFINDLVGEPRAEVAKHNIDSIFYESLPALEFYPSSQSIENVIQSGNLNLIKNQEIITLFNQWKTLQDHINDRESTSDDWINQSLIPFIVKYISFRDMDLYGDLYWAKPSKLKRDYYPLFQNVEFESIMDNSIYLQEMNRRRLEEAKILIDKILAITVQYIEE
jgi:hypothetical protein